MNIRRLRYLLVLISAVIMLLAIPQASFAVDDWNVKSIAFTPASDTVKMSTILKQDNDGPYKLDLAYRNGGKLNYCFFTEGDECTVKYKDGTSKTFKFKSTVNPQFANFEEAGGSEVILLEALSTELSREIRNGVEGSADELAAVIGTNKLQIEYGKYDPDTGLGQRVLCDCSIKVEEDKVHNCTEALRGRSENEPLCEASGFSKDCYWCQVCGQYYLDSDATQPVNKKDVYRPMLGHDFSNSKWTTVKKATEKAAGMRSRKCSRCGTTETKETAQLKPTLPKVTILDPKAAKKSAAVKWKKVSKKDLKKIKEIQIQYSMDSRFRTGVKTASASAGKTSKKITKMKSGKTYYIRIRALNGKHVSAWSRVKAVMVK